jgi:hypothetical protein
MTIAAKVALWIFVVIALMKVALVSTSSTRWRRAIRLAHPARYRPLGPRRTWWRSWRAWGWEQLLLGVLFVIVLVALIARWFR